MRREREERVQEVTEEKWILKIKCQIGKGRMRQVWWEI